MLQWPQRRQDARRLAQADSAKAYLEARQRERARGLKARGSSVSVERRPNLPSRRARHAKACVAGFRRLASVARILG
jgi:hypothetical protein